MLNNYYILKAQANHLNKTIKNYSIEDSFILEKNVFSIILKSEKTISLKFIFEKNLESLFTEEFQQLPRKNIMSVFPEIVSKIIIGVETEDKNRVLRIILSDGTIVAFYAVPNRSNIFILNGEKIVDCYREKNEYVGNNISTLIRKPVNKTISDDSTLQNFVNSNYFFIGKNYREELIHRVEKNYPECGVDDLHDIAEKFINSLNHPDRFTLYLCDEKVIPALTSLHKYEGFDKLEFDDINSLIINCYRKSKHLIEKSSVKGILIADLEAKLKRLDNKIKNLKSAINEARDYQLYKTYGDVLLINMSEVDLLGGFYSFKDDAGYVFNIKLNPLLSIPENANHYYGKYKGLKNSVESLEKKLIFMEKEKDELISKKIEIEKEENLKVIRKMDKRENIKNDAEKLPFRIFKLNDKFEVWVGKDSASNDLLTMKHTNQYDLWFHVRGSSGSHTILKFLDKNLTPEKEYILKAASIAAYYSKARNGKHIPVAYCEKKYVKKRKGFKQGAVVMEKEKIVFVDPKIPD